MNRPAPWAEKFLVAGEGGLNITNRVEGEEMLGQYAPKDRMRPILAAFGPAELRAWLAELGVPTFIGSSGRVFPEKGIKPAEVLKAIVDRLAAKGVQLHVQHTFVGFDAVARPLVERDGQQVVILKAEEYLFALGGASWAKTELEQELGRSISMRWASEQFPCGQQLRRGACHAGSLACACRQAVEEHPHNCWRPQCEGRSHTDQHGLEGNAVYPVVLVESARPARGQESYVDH